MNSVQKKSSILTGFFKKLFASPKSPAKKLTLSVFLAVLVLGVFATTFVHAQSTPTQPAQKPLTQEEIMKISGWDNWDSNNKNLPAGTKLSDPICVKYDGDYCVESVYHLIPSDKTTVTDVTGYGVRAVEKGAGLIGSAINKIAMEVVITVLTVLAGFCKLLLMYAGQALDVTLNPNLYFFTNNPMVVQGWIVVRDICNLFFLLVLLFIAICTILKIDKYHAKKTLLTLIIMALLINFSKAIAVFVFDGSQLLMNFFLTELTRNGASPSAKLAEDIATFLYRDLMNHLVSQPSTWTIAVYYLFVVVFLFMFAVALFVMALFMIIRIVAIMVLVIVSPLAFFAAIVPDFSKMSSSWWSALFKYCYYGPAAAFFLFLAAKFAIATSNALPRINIQGDGNIVIQHIISYLTVLVFLYASIIMSQQFGLFAANAIVGNANKFMKWAGGMTKTGGMWGWGSRSLGVTGGVSQRLQQSGLTRWMTKEGRKRIQRGREAAVASFLGVTGARTKRLKEAADDLKNESNVNIQRMAEGGDMVAAYVASNRGILNNNIVNAIQPQLNRDADMRNEFVRNARKNGQAHQALNIRLQTAGLEEGAMHNNPAAIANNEITRIATSELVKSQNVNDLAQIPQGLAALITAFDELNNRLTTGTPAQQAAAQQQLNNIISNASAQNLAALSANRPAAPGGPRPIMP